MSSTETGQQKRKHHQAIVSLERLIRLDKKLSNFTIYDGKIK